MKKRILAMLLSATAYTAAASDLIDQASGRAVSPDDEARPVRVINMWATWCAPCRAEMPELSRFAEKNPQVAVVGVAFDNENNIRRFLRSVPVRYPIRRYAGRDSAAYMKTLGNTVGALPYTAVTAPACDFRRSFFGAIDVKALEAVTKEAQQACERRRAP